jgi:hypothetical protein
MAHQLSQSTGLPGQVRYFPSAPLTLWIYGMQIFRSWPERRWAKSLWRSMKCISANAPSAMRRPSACVQKTVQRRLICCCFCVAQMQLLGSYIPLLSLRSKVVRIGLGPISARNVSKVLHLSQMAIPRPPYRWNFTSLGLRQRLRMLLQELYSLTNLTVKAARGCLTMVLSIDGLMALKALVLRQPQLLLSPFFSVYARTFFVVPQSHRQIHFVGDRPSVRGTSSRTTQRPKRWPDISWNGIAMHRFYPINIGVG